MTDWLLNPPSVTTLTALGAVGVLLLIALTALIVNMPPKEQPMSDRAQRAFRTFIQAFIGSAGVLIAGKLAGVKTLEDLSGLASSLVPIVTAGVSAGISAVMAVLFPPKAPGAG